MWGERGVASCCCFQTEGLREGKLRLCWGCEPPATQPLLALSSPFTLSELGLLYPFLQVGGVYSYDCSFVCNVELMKFIAMATFGSYLLLCPEPEPGNLGLTVYHRAFLLYSFLRSGKP